MVIGFCFSGVYVTAESWLNNAADNENRGQALSLYMIVQMVGIVAAQASAAGGRSVGLSILFVIPSVLVSISFAPILLSISPTPAFDTTKPMSLRAAHTRSRRWAASACSCWAASLRRSSAWRGLRRQGRADAWRRSRSSSRRSTSGAHGAAISDRLDVGPDGPARADPGGGRGRRRRRRWSG